MSPRRAQSRDKSRTTWPIALLAMLALLVQALIPAAAMAHDAAGQSVMICTADGAKVEQVSGDVIGKKDPKGFAGLPCAQCLAVALATTTAPDVAVAPVLYGVHVAPAPVAALTGVALARAPPRPPGQGPPTA